MNATPERYQSNDRFPGQPQRAVSIPTLVHLQRDYCVRNVKFILSKPYYPEKFMWKREIRY